MNERKAIILVEGEAEDCFNLSNLICNEDKVYIDTNCQTEVPEVVYLVNVLGKFLKSDIQFMVIRYSGNDSIAQEIGDRFPEMIISLSYNNNSKYYVDNPRSVFSTFIDSIKKEKV